MSILKLELLGQKKKSLFSFFLQISSKLVHLSFYKTKIPLGILGNGTSNKDTTPLADFEKEREPAGHLLVIQA